MLIRSIARSCVIKANDGPWTIDHYMYVWIRYNCLSSFYALLSSLLFYTFFMSCWLRSLSLELFTSDERRFCKLSAWNNNKIAKLSQRSQEINKRQMQIRTLVYRLVKLKETYTQGAPNLITCVLVTWNFKKILFIFLKVSKHLRHRHLGKSN